MAARWDTLWDAECRRTVKSIKSRNTNALTGYYALLLLFLIIGLCGYILKLRKLREDVKRVNKNCCCKAGECKSKKEDKRPSSRDSQRSKKRNKKEKVSKTNKKRSRSNSNSSSSIICDESSSTSSRNKNKKKNKKKKVQTCGNFKKCDYLTDNDKKKKKSGKRRRDQ